MTRPGTSLFLKVYLTLLASLAVVAIAGALAFHWSQDHSERSWTGRGENFLAAMLPADADPRMRNQVLRRLSRAFDADITLYDEGGDPISTVGRPLPRDIVPRWRERRHAAGRSVLVTPLADGRMVVARLNAPLPPGGPGALFSLAVIAAAIGLAAYPVMRRLTHRLEALRGKVETWGSGALMERVPVEGRDEVGALAVSFNAAADRIERLLAAHRALLANASHELRSPLARLRIAIDLYESRPDATIRDEIVESLGELDQLVEEILLASRLDHVGRLDRRETVDLLALAAEESARSGVPVTGETAMVTGDPRLLARLLRNLMHNARRHGAPPFGAMVERRGDSVELSVRDAGKGIAEKDGERVFEPFYRPSGYGDSAGGWGLGLALARQIAERHGGGIRLDRPAEGGTCFVVTLPAADA